MRRKKTSNPSLRPLAHLDGKDGPFCAKADVARRDQVDPGAEADTVHGGDDGFVARLNGRDAALQEIHVLGRGFSECQPRLPFFFSNASLYGDPPDGCAELCGLRLPICARACRCCQQVGTVVSPSFPPPLT